MNSRPQNTPPPLAHRRIFVIADIEGSSGCFSHENGKFMGRGWPRACREMSRDVAALCKGLLRAGAREIQVKDFHRTGYNLIPELIPPSVKLRRGYYSGPVPGLGHPGDATALIMVGLHAPSGAKGFLPHTLTSRLARIELFPRKERPHLLTEAQLFANSLAGHGIVPLFFSGDGPACAHAAKAIPGLQTFALDKFAPGFQARTWRREMAAAAVSALAHPTRFQPYAPQGPFRAVVTLRDGVKAAEKQAQAWGFTQHGNQISMEGNQLQDIYAQLIRLAYLTPFKERISPIGLPLFNLIGRAGLFLSQRIMAP
ncbi:MAG: M55 family metallopeptidase [Desulfobacterales bacterium]|nr:M55 family metallopeptidase [Desulfobacterales bacterium]